MEQSYAGYDAWKGWEKDHFMRLSDPLRAYYRAEFQGISVEGANVLEIGFGNGALLAWLEEQGAQLYGTEISPYGISLASQRGVIILDSELPNPNALAGKFGLVAAFDVLEHLTSSQIADLMNKVAIMLCPNGFFVARFPNGGSPFGRMLQHGDATHINALTAGKIGQLMDGKLMTIVRVADAATPISGGLAIRAVKNARNVFRKGFEFILRAMYSLDGPLYPNMIIVAQRTPEQTEGLPADEAASGEIGRIA